MLVCIAASVPRLRALIANERLVRLYLFTGPAERLHLQNAHCFAQPMAHEPCRLHGDFQRAAQLMAADALLARAEQERRLKPLVQRNVALLENSADLDGKLLAAGVTLFQTDPVAAI